mmetsp:Transcript_19435/g.33406  ORF Transcript_19435/g.33406 Transcript_19435/m.33406 type:complete len:388 (+) Transcript_19435:85-1248(+)|eukprot:CAMPEP_0196656608 /NCGR_PEP_ID=MMETSP1086-20130531/18766_1 /TAXON_ID=77921 /ORGANISM="Cyanoptyche  gloeocystis , Strain SAG4.97" /LENGTH=387 /DNA_ID=CAMNT_0041989437 /DNA_START=67 /DNA_END=1230 /DNA_ORIENTATION=-
MAVPEPTRLFGELALDYQHYQGFTPVQVPAQPPPVQRPANISFNDWAASQKDIYFQLEEEAHHIAGSSSKLAEHNDIVEHLARAKERADKDVKTLRAAEKEAEHKLEKAKESKKKIFAPGKYKKKLEARTKALEDIQGELKVAQQTAAQADSQLQPALQEKARLEALAKREYEIRGHQEAILNAMFEGLAGDDAENQAEQAVKFFYSMAGPIEQAMADQKAALQYVSKAAECMERMLGLMKRAQASNTVDVFSDGLIGMMAGANTNAALAEANHMGKEAQALIQHAHKYSPYMPSARKVNTGFGALGGFCNIVFDNAFMDIMQGAMIAKQMEQVKQAYSEAMYSAKWQQQFVKNIIADREQNARNLHAARQRLLSERMRLINTIGRS